jgi:NADPH:quinone reductase-like Zn-dependent oxidoreductase
MRPGATARVGCAPAIWGADMKVRKVRMHGFGGPEVLKLDTVEQSLPDAGQVLVRVKAASINPVDFKIREGKYPAVKEDRLPYTVGRDVSGIIEQCGAQATRFQVGDEVVGIAGLGYGGYAEQTVLEERALAGLPSSINHPNAAAIPLAGTTAWQGLFRYGELMPGQSVLIHGGSGGVGHLAVQFAKAKGARVLTTVSTENVAFAHELGADVVIDYKKERFEDHAQQLDLVLDLVDGETRERSWPLLKRGGKLITTLTAPSPELASKYGVRARRYTVEAHGGELAEMLALVIAGQVKPHVQQMFRLDEATQALAIVEKGHAVGKVVLSVS